MIVYLEVGWAGESEFQLYDDKEWGVGFEEELKSMLIYTDVCLFMQDHFTAGISYD